MVESIFDKEDEEDFRCCNEQLQLWSFDPIEVEAHRVYTRKIYSLFKDLFRQSTMYTTYEVEKDALYEVKRTHDPTAPNRRILSYVVRVNKKNTEVSCNCHGFEFQGLLCSHSLKVMLVLGMKLHPRYVLPRWTKEANQGLKRYQSDIRSVEALQSDTERYEHLRMKAMMIVDDFWKPFKMYTIVTTKLEKWYKELGEIAKSMQSDMSTEHVGATDGMLLLENVVDIDEMNYRDPPQSQCKGKRKPQRFKHPIEKKLRTCTNCLKKEGHNSRTCPQDSSKEEL